MNKLLILLSAILLATSGRAANYDKLWANVKESMDKDLPKDAMSKLQEIKKISEKEHAYGEFLAASIYHARIEAEVTPDSLTSAILRLHDQALKAEKTDAVLASVCYTVMGKLCNLTRNVGSDNAGKFLSDNEYYDRALAHPDLLASCTTDAYKRLIQQGEDDGIFNNDLLSFVGHQAERYEFLKHYYLEHGNRRAACIEHLNWVRDVSFSDDDQGITLQKKMLNDGMKEYVDCPESALFAYDYFQLIRRDDDVSRKSCYDYLQNAIKRYELLCQDNDTVYSNVLRNALQDYTRSSFNLVIDNDRLLLSNIVNVKDLQIEFIELNADRRDDIRLYGEKERKRLASLQTGFKETVNCTYDRPVWEIHSDTINIPRIPYGVYLVKASTGNASNECVFYYSDLSVLSINEGNDSEPRIIVISKTTGEQIKNATIELDKKNRTVWVGVNKGKTKDLGFKKTYIYNTFGFSKHVEEKNIVNIFTDRSIYRPGQSIKGSVLVYNQANTDSIHVVDNQEVTVRLLDSSDKEIGTKTITTDSMGNGGFEFDIPQNGKNGFYYLDAKSDNSRQNFKSIRVEEYKRPTFEVNVMEAKKYEETIELDKGTDSLTVDVRFKATTYSQVPVRDTKVKYSVVREPNWWFRWRSGTENTNRRTIIGEATATTDNQGIVTLPLTLSLPEKSIGRYNFNIQVSVTDKSGETHEANLVITACHKHDGSTTTGEQKEAKPDFELSAESFPNDGGKVSFIMRNPKPQTTYAYYTIHAESKLLESSMVEFTSEYRRDFSYRKEYGDALTISYVWVMDGVEHKFTRTIIKPQPDLKLPAKWTTFRDHTQPGSHETWTLKVGNAKDKPLAALTAAIYDKSLDAIAPNDWNFNIIQNSYNHHGEWRWMCNSRYLPLDVRTSFVMMKDKPSFRLAQFYENLMPYRTYYSRLLGASDMKFKSMTLMSKAPMAMNDMAVEAPVAREEAAMVATNEKMSDATTQDLSALVRQDLAETAYFTPSLLSDEDGNITLSFTMPETMTTWQLRGFVHDEKMRTAMLDTTCIARKDIIVKPNAPRFLRENDNTVIAASISNTTSHPQNAKVLIQLLIPGTDSIVWQNVKDITIGAENSTGVTFDVPAINGTDSLLVCRIAATTSEGTSDGEQHYIPVLPASEMVTTTLAFTQHDAGSYTKDISDMLLKDSSDRKLRVKYTPHAVQMILDAVPSATHPFRKDVNSMASATYVATLFCQDDTLRQELTSELGKLQLSDGSWPWWEGMKGTVWTTTSTARLLARLDLLGVGNKETNDMLARSLSYLMGYATKEASSLREMQKKYPKQKFHPSETCTDILYVFALSSNAGIKKAQTLLSKNQKDVNYLLKLLEDSNNEFTIYGKAHAAALLAYYGRTTKAKEHLESLKQYSVCTEEAGRYYDSPKAYYSWRNYRIPSEVAAMEAIRIVTPQDKQTIDEMKRWLLHEKRTQQWDNSINTADAVFAFMLDNDEVEYLKNNPATTEEDMPTITLDGREIPSNSIMAIDKAGVLRVDKKTNGTSWGAVFVSQRAPLSSIRTTGTGFRIKREIVTDKKTLNVGDRLTVRITIDADRDYDFVEVCDHRAACLEPVEQLSGYCSAITGGTARYSYSGYYRITHDNNTEFFFDRLAKGTHVIETDYYVDRQGTYNEGTCTVSCSYAPEFSGIETPKTITVK